MVFYNCCKPSVVVSILTCLIPTDQRLLYAGSVEVVGRFTSSNKQGPWVELME